MIPAGVLADASFADISHPILLVSARVTALSLYFLHIGHACLHNSVRPHPAPRWIRSSRGDVTYDTACIKREDVPAEVQSGGSGVLAYLLCHGYQLPWLRLS